MDTTRTDFATRDEGSIVILWAITDEAVQWCEEHLPDDLTTWGSAVVIEHRYARPIIYGMLEDGLVGRAA